MLPALIPLAPMNVLATVDLREMESTVQVRMHYIYIYIYIMLQKAAFGKDCHADAIHTLASNGNKLQLLMNPPNHMRHMFPYRY